MRGNALRGQAAEKDVLGDGQLRDQAEFLINRLDSGVLGVLRAAAMQRLATENDRSAVGRLGARQDFHQCRLSRPVLPGESVNAASPHVEVDALQSLNADIALRDARDLQLQGGIGRPCAGRRSRIDRHLQEPAVAGCARAGFFATADVIIGRSSM